MRLLVCGDRNWTDVDLIKHVLEDVLEQALIMPTDEDQEIFRPVLIEGEARGVDSIAATIARAYGVPVIPFPADWTKYGKAAGPIRNKQMLDEGKPSIVFAFHDDLEHSRGTKDMITQALDRGLIVRWFSHGTGMGLYSMKLLARKAGTGLLY